MKPAVARALIPALVLWIASVQAYHTHQAHHHVPGSAHDVDIRDVPLDPARSISWDPKNIPTEPALGTCLIDSQMTIKAVAGDNICQNYKIDITSTFSWVATPNMSYVDTDRNGATSTGCIANVAVSPINLPKSVSGTSQSHASGSNGALSVSGIPVSTNISNLGGFQHVLYTVLAAQELKYPGNSDPVFRDFGRGFLSPLGILGFGQIKTGSVGGWDGYKKNTAVHTSPLMEAISSPGGPIPMWTLAMPRNDERDVIIIGGYISSTTFPGMDWGLENVATVEGAPCDGPAADGYCVNVLGLDTLTGSKTTPMDPEAAGSAATYLLDSLSKVIRTSNATAGAVAALFMPPGHVDPSSGAWYVDCSDTLSQTIGLRLQGEVQRAFLISKQDMIIHLPDGKCISAFQPPDSSGKYRLGWPFLRNTAVAFHIHDAPTNLTIEQRVLSENPALQLID